MQPHLTLGRIFGITIGLHFSWVIIALLITLSLAAHFQEINPDWAMGTIWTTALLTGLLFFVSIVVHEMGHALVARARGVPVRSITLFALGGVANIEKEAGDPNTEFWMGIAGPLMSVAIGVLCLGLTAMLGGFESTADITPPTPAMALFAWLGYINLMRAAFNMLPGFPLDGGRVLRAALWWITGDRLRATRVATRVGQVVALLLITIGVIGVFSGEGFGGLWMAIIGWFLFDASGQALAQTELLNELRGLRVRDILTDDCVRVNADLSVQTLADEYVLRGGRRCFLIEDAGRPAGLVVASDLRQIDQERWRMTPVRDVMRPLNRLKTISPDAPVSEAFQVMGREDINQLPVVSNGHLEGVLSRGQILRALESRAELSM
jgi:Zn-dependent protease/CBS domain-containing protein